MFRPSFSIPARRARASGFTAGMGGRSVWLALLTGTLLVLQALLLTLATTATAATPAGTAIDNVATASFNGGLTITSNQVRIITVPTSTPALIEFLQYAPGVQGNEAVPVPPTNYLAGGQPVPIPPPDFVDGPVPLLPTPLYHVGEDLILRLTDLDQDLDPARADTVLLTVTCTETGDVETLILTETGPNTGVFTGYLPSVGNGAIASDGRLLVVADCHLTARYVDPDDGSDSVVTTALIDPYGIVFDSATGKPVDGASVTIVDAVTGQPAQVWGDDGITPFPATVTTGDPTFGFPPGGFRFPYVRPGSYRFVVAPPAGYAPPPSGVPFAELQQLPGAPFALVAGSLGAPFPINPGPAVHIDIPVDPQPEQLALSKSASRSVADLGDFIQYRLLLQNSGATREASRVVLVDRLPLGFRYQQGSLRIDGGKVSDPAISADGRTLQMPVGVLAPGTQATISYVTEITAGTEPGEAINTAQATAAGGLRSNQAQAGVLVKDPFLRDKAFLAGRVMVGACAESDDGRKPGLAGLRIYLEDGSYVLTDAEGRYHFEGIDPGVHVVQLDFDTLPARYELLPCETDNQSAGRSFSRFVDVQGGTLWRADFYVALKPLPQGAVSLALSSTVDGDLVQLQLPLAVAGEVDLANLRLSLILPAGTGYVPGSSRIDGQPLADPEGGGQILTYRLGDQAAGWGSRVNLQARITAEASGELPVKAVLTCDAPQQKNLRSPMVETLLQAPVVPGAAATVVKGDSGPQSVAFTGLRPGEAADLAAAGSRTTEIDMPAFDLAWMAREAPGIAWLWPLPEAVPATASVKAAIKHLPLQTVALRINGQLVSPLAFEGTRLDGDGRLAVSIWRGIDIERGDNLFEATVSDRSGQVVATLRQTIHYSYAPVHADLVPGESILIADGKTPPVIAVRFTDKDGYPASAGLVGELSLPPPYLTYVDREQGTLGLDAEQRSKFRIEANGIAHIRLEPTTQAGEVIMTFPFTDRTEELRAWLQPAMRDWILVGFAQGTAGYQTLSGHKVSAEAAGVEDDYYSDGEVKFFAKGAIKGEWLLTLAYDSDKPDLDGDSLQQVIDPDRYYPLYGDSTQQGYEAASAENLYVKLERGQFYAMFGDMQTGLTQTVLSRYSRTLNGFKSELQGERFSYTLFAAETKQSFVKDEMRGDGTSGRYRLSNQRLAINSESIVIETRDRFHNEIIVSEVPLARHLDYDIDYDAGTLYFKRPVPSKDENFNPIFIVVRYETKVTAKSNMNYGGRAAVKVLDQRVEVGASYVHEDNGGNDGDLYGTDVTVHLTPLTVLRAEVATTDATDDDGARKGDAYLAEIKHQGDRLDGRAWFRQQDSRFGLGQQNNGTNGMRTYGVEGAYDLTPDWSLAAIAYHEDNLETDAKRDVESVEARYQTDRFGLSLGARTARDRFVDSADQTSQQLLLGGEWTSFDRRLTLRANHDQSIGDNENSDFPTRSIIGADYLLTESVVLFAAQEFTWGDDEDTQGTRVGIKANPWQGGEVRSALEQQIDENGPRVFALFGVGQSWQIDNRWSIDLSVDRSETLVDRPNEARVNDHVPPASGGDDDFTAVSLGAAYLAENWSWWNRLETRQGDDEDKIGFSSGLVGDLREGLAASLHLLALVSNQSGGIDSDEEEIRLGLAYRPNQSRWIILERLDLAHDGGDYDDGSDFTSWRAVNHLHANYRASRKWQSSGYLGLKYVRETFDGDRYDGFTNMLAAETRYNIDSRWDIGLNGAALHSWNGNQVDYSAGGSVGFLVMTNTWVSAGYNVTGFEDDDFSSPSYTAQGPFIRFRVKFDQQSVREAAEWLNR